MTATTIVVRPKGAWRWGFPAGTVALVAVALASWSWFGVVFVGAGLVATAMAWRHRIVVDEARMTVTHHRPPLHTRVVRISLITKLTCHYERSGNERRVRLRIHDARGGRIVIKVWLWSAWRQLARAVAVHASDRLALDETTARGLGLVENRGGPDVWIPPDPDV